MQAPARAQSAPCGLERREPGAQSRKLRGDGAVALCRLSLLLLLLLLRLQRRANDELAGGGGGVRAKLRHLELRPLAAPRDEERGEGDDDEGADGAADGAAHDGA